MTQKQSSRFIDLNPWHTLKYFHYSKIFTACIFTNGHSFIQKLDQLSHPQCASKLSFSHVKYLSSHWKKIYVNSTYVLSSLCLDPCHTYFWNSITIFHHFSYNLTKLNVTIRQPIKVFEILNYSKNSQCVTSS